MTWSEFRRRLRAELSRLPLHWGPEAGRVTRVHLAAGEAGGLGRPHAIDVLLLDADGKDRADVPELKHVELPAFGLGPGAAVWAVPKVGSRVRVGFYAGRISRPYVDAVLQDGQQVPERDGDTVLARIGELDIMLRRDGSLDVHGAGPTRFGVSRAGSHDAVMCYSDASADLAQLEQQLLAWAAGINTDLAALDAAVQLRLTAATGGATTPVAVTSAGALSLSLTHGTAARNLNAEVTSGE
jgi:hypothetical protein